MSLNTVAIELVPPDVDRGAGYAREEAQKMARLATEGGGAEPDRAKMSRECGIAHV
ncbi:mycobacterial-type methylenetetrahydrofolate reductase [Mycolicibacterium porcinum]|uniref:mycobacterial-type methylenetetrahydrofolate reductase n=1 Tax=Mycolicibacterium porcinum TaxID=39693 RepID=UPI0013F4CD9B|nr:mycobacterial-type methylenetetrahydrofolate reductase [Mycolicibacterium porcinum]